MLAPVDAQAGWTVVGPGGDVASYASPDALRASLAESGKVAIDDARRRSEMPPTVRGQVVFDAPANDDAPIEELSRSDVDVELLSVLPANLEAAVNSKSDPNSVRSTFKFFPAPQSVGERPAKAAPVVVGHSGSISPMSRRPTAPPPAAVVATPPILPRVAAAMLVAPRVIETQLTPPVPVPALEEDGIDLLSTDRSTMRGLGVAKNVLVDDSASPRIVIARSKSEPVKEVPTSPVDVGFGKPETVEVMDYLDQLEDLLGADEGERAKERLSAPPTMHRSVYPRVKEVDVQRASGRLATAPAATPTPVSEAPKTRASTAMRVASAALPPPTDPTIEDPYRLEESMKRSAFRPPAARRRAGILVAGAAFAAASGILVLCLQASTAPPMAALANHVAATPNGAPMTAKPPVAKPKAQLATPPIPTPAPEPVAEPSAPAPSAKPMPVAKHTGPEIAPASASAADDALPPNELLHRAHASLRAGDLKRAKQQFELVRAKDPQNVEASTGLGDVARANTDFMSARQYYLQALAVSPSYMPAQLALADVKWELGDRTDARARYAAIVEKLGERAPARARERR